MNVRISLAALVCVVSSTLITIWFTESIPSALIANVVGLTTLGLIAYHADVELVENRLEFVKWLLPVRIPSLKYTCVAVGIVFVGFLFRFFVGLAKDLFSPGSEAASHSVTANTAPTGVELALVFLAVAVIGPLMEEWIFRGIIQRFLSEHVHAATAIVVTSVFFGLLHIESYGGFGTPLEVLAIPIFIVTFDSLLWGWLYNRTGNVMTTFIAHGGSNAVALALWVA